jgi:hypothetical protein
MFEMILFLTNQVFHLFYRLSLWLHTVSVCGLFSSLWRSARLWILGATIWQRLHGIYTAGTAGGLISDYHVDAKAVHVTCYF